ncbi:MAG TPA: helix-turn-helix domain-containing protein [Frankiaceae bacterium]
MSIGESLRAARTERGLDLDALARTTRLRASLISRIESDDFAGCGGAVYARAHIRAVAKAVGLDPAPLVAEFDAQHGSAPEPTPVPVVVDQPDRAGSRRPGRSPSPWFAAAVVVLVAVIALVGANLFAGGSPSTVRAGSPAPPPAGSPTPPAAAGTPTTPPSPPPAAAPAPGGGSSGVSMQVLASAASWISVTDPTQGELFQGVLSAGDTKDFHATDQLSVRLGNAGGVALTVNGRSLGTVGARGQVVSLQFGPGDPTAKNAA